MTRSCTLDTLHPDDRSALVRLFTSELGREFLGGPLEPELASQRSMDWVDLSPTSPIWAIRRCDDQSFLGYVMLDDYHNGIDTEISYALLPEHWGRGYASDALVEAFARARNDLGLEVLVAETQAKNHRSIDLLKRIGMSENRRLARFGAEQVVYRIAL